MKVNNKLPLIWIKHQSLCQYPFFAVRLWWLDAQHAHFPAALSTDHEGDLERGHNAADAPGHQHDSAGHVHHVAAQQAVVRLRKSQHDLRLHQRQYRLKQIINRHGVKMWCIVSPWWLNVAFWQVGLGQYPENHFFEDVPCKVMKDFQGELEILSTVIKTRNKSLDVPYVYMDPVLVENSVAIWTSQSMTALSPCGSWFIISFAPHRLGFLVSVSF